MNDRTTPPTHRDDATRVRQGETPGVVRRILAFSLAAAVLALALVWALA